MNEEMNWKEHAHLFANGKFKFMVFDEIKDAHSYEIGHQDFVFCQRAETNFLYRQKGIKLIARKIDDLTDGEIKWFLFNEKYPMSKPYIDDMRQFIPMWAKNNEFTQEQFLHLLSIGVYPFSQKHFEDETVIDIKTLIEEQK